MISKVRQWRFFPLTFFPMMTLFMIIEAMKHDIADYTESWLESPVEVLIKREPRNVETTGIWL